jgi:hypothetical protein
VGEDDRMARKPVAVEPLRLLREIQRLERRREQILSHIQELSRQLEENARRSAAHRPKK